MIGISDTTLRQIVTEKLEMHGTTKVGIAIAVSTAIADNNIVIEEQLKKAGVKIKHV